MPEPIAAPLVNLAHACTQDEVCQNLNTTTHGLTQGEASSRLERYGKNQLSPKKKISPFRLYLQQYQNTLTIILLIAALLVLFTYFFGGRDTSDLIESGLIVAIVVMITLLGFFQEFKAEKAIESLKKMLAYKTKVIRDGHEQEIDVILLVPGDIVMLEEGAKVPADMRLLSVSGLSINEASLTGESVAVSKTTEVSVKNAQLADQKNMAFAGTAVTSGRAIGVVVKTGDTTEIGKIAASIAEVEDEQTPIQKKLNKIGKTIASIIIGICIVVFVFIMFFARDYTSLPLIQRILHSFVVAVALAVAAIPEGLAAVVTITLALGTQRMLKKNVLVRKLNAIETLGSTDIICSDKTGTLTKGEMTVTNLYFNGELYDVSGVGYETTGEFSIKGKRVEATSLEQLLLCGFYCNNASLKEDGGILGDPTEAALLVSAAKGRVAGQSERIMEIPFTSDRKMMSVIIKADGKYIVFAKGAPEVILNHCAAFDREKASATISAMSQKALRVLAFATKELSEEAYSEAVKDQKKFEEQLVFLGLQGMIDPPRLEVAPLIAQCHASGIRVIMITGDHEETAKAVAKEIGIPGTAITGAVLDELSDADFAKTVRETSVYARVSPAFKMRIVDALQKDSHIVAMTGDGVNDAPALKKADIGIAMGITGTDVSKEASDIVLLDDKFSTIVAAIEEGRGIYRNMQKFVSHLLTCNLSEVLLVFTAILFFQKLPLTALMLLWINIVTDGLPAIALGLDKAEKGILSYPPKLFQQDILTKRLWVEMVIFGVLIAGAVLAIFLQASPSGVSVAQGSAFAAIVLFESVMVYLIRSRYHIKFFSNLWLFAAILLTVIVQIVIAYHPFGNTLFGISPLELTSWVSIVLISAWLGIVFILMQRFFDYVGFEKVSVSAIPEART